MAQAPLRIGLALLLSVGLWAPAKAAKEAALIVAAQGAISPEPEAFSEAAEGANYSLAADAELIVMHYASCTESHFKGGDVTVGKLGVKTTGFAKRKDGHKD